MRFCKKCFLQGIIFFVLYSSSLFVLVNGEASWVVWRKTFGGTNYDQFSSLVKTSDGGYALAGRTTSFGFGDSDGWLIKTDVSGNIEWNQTYGGTGYDVAYSLIQTSDDGFALAGSSGPEYISTDFWLVKTDGSGNMEWNRTYGGARIESATSLVETSDGGYALAGSTTTFGFGNSDGWLVKTDGSGNKEWNRNYGGEVNDSAYSLIQMSDGGFALAGETESFGAGGYDGWFILTNVQGVPEFSSWIILLLFLMATFVGVILKKRLSHNLH